MTYTETPWGAKRIVDAMQDAMRNAAVYDEAAEVAARGEAVQKRLRRRLVDQELHLAELRTRRREQTDSRYSHEQAERDRLEIRLARQAYAAGVDLTPEQAAIVAGAEWEVDQKLAK